MSVKTPASWSAHAWSTRPGYPSGPVGFVNVDLFKGHIGGRERDHTVVWS